MLLSKRPLSNHLSSSQVNEERVLEEEDNERQ